MGLRIKIPFTSHTVESLIDAVLVKERRVREMVETDFLHVTIVAHVVLVLWIVLWARQKPPRVRDKVDLSKES